MSRRARAAIVAVAAAISVAGCGETSRAPLTIGVLAECGGPFASFYEPSLAAAELPLLARGARLMGASPQAGVDRAIVGGHHVRLVFGCTQESATTTIAQVRRLVEERGARVVVGGLVADEGLALLAYAARRPDVTFLITAPSVDAVTLRRPRPNVFRFAPDPAQLTAGLGSYAYHVLGWRLAEILGERVAFDYGEAAGFVSEFCSLGGRIARRVWVRRGTAGVAGSLDASGVDGAAVFTLTRGVDLVRAFAPRGPLGRRIVVDVVLAGQLVPTFGKRAQGVAWAWPNATDPGTPAWRSYVAATRRWFPHQQSMPFLFPLVYDISLEAVARALESGAALRTALARSDFLGPLGPVRLDRDRQLVATNQVVVIDVRAGARLVRTVSVVDGRLGGLLQTKVAPAGPTQPACLSRTPPAWAR